ncbi:MAG: hypothetical protein JXR73_20055 [Candidatus Omnitrophica bacterium]|nr:hypothetical protein [Candidatus Omnitrophota bacterium]
MAGFIQKIRRIALQFFSVVLILIIGGAVWFIASHTIVQTEKEYIFAKKESWSFENNYVDVREWSLFDYLEHPEIAAALIEAGYKDIQESLENSEEKARLNEAIQKTGEALQSIADPFKK